MIYRFSAFFLLILAGCKTAQKPIAAPVIVSPKVVESTLQITELQANDLEENLASFTMQFTVLEKKRRRVSKKK
ncbi:MAG: hypothetical protein EAZ32_16405 [Cytophagia bacterium]|nr:MAG: hypothetical protein EAZ38_00525 [Cytophagales bacterium]TAG36848.1 MAG: hypothetical protein EAZ32_16405 [Cytophagia bacterium]TAG84408.1 MAG: hypothetical protein EAZ22_00695 [Cytophagales bacterium]